MVRPADCRYDCSEAPPCRVRPRALDLRLRAFGAPHPDRSDDGGPGVGGRTASPSQGATPDHARLDQRQRQSPRPQRPRREARQLAAGRPPPAAEHRGRAGGPREHPAGERRPARCGADPQGRGLLPRHPPGHLPGGPRPVRPGQGDRCDHPGRRADPPRPVPRDRRRRHAGADPEQRPARRQRPLLCRHRPPEGDRPPVDRGRQRDPPRGLLEQLHRRGPAGERRATGLQHRRGADQGGHGRAEPGHQRGHGPDRRAGRVAASDHRHRHRLFRASTTSPAASSPSS